MTPRWTPIREANGGGLSGERRAYYIQGCQLNEPGCPVKVITVPSGRRSLKTELASRIMARALGKVKPWADPRYGILAPTRAQVKMIEWEKMKALVPKDWVSRIYETDLMIRTRMGSELWLIGMDKPSRIEGPPWDGLHLTEYADFKSSWDQNIAPALMDRDGWAILEGTPDFEKPNNVKYEEQHNLGLDPKFPQYRTYSWSSETVLHPRKIEEARATMDPLYFQQEMGGLFVSAPGLAYYGYVDRFSEGDISGNLSHNAVLDPSLPIWVMCDFNFGHHNWSIGQVAYDQRTGMKYPRVCKQVYSRNTEVNGMCETVKQILAEWEADVRRTRPTWSLDQRTISFTGDYSGNQRRPESTKTAWRIVQDQFPQAEFFVKPNINIPDRLRLTNGYLCNTNGDRRLEIAEECTELRKDFRYVTRKQLMTADKGGDRSHASDGVGYWLRVIDNID